MRKIFRFVSDNEDKIVEIFGFGVATSVGVWLIIMGLFVW